MNKDLQCFIMKAISTSIISIRILIFLIPLLLSSLSNAQSKRNGNNIKTAQVPFISFTPVIDGQLDTDLEHLSENSFNHIWQFDNPVTDTIQITYKMAYTASHLYIYIEADIDSITYHRRGYLWGDGYKVLFARPQLEGLTSEYYELAFSPTIEKEYEWAKQRIVYYNFDQTTLSLSSSTISQESANRNISGFETLIAWEDVKPYHPWFMKDMGYNIYFAKGMEHPQHGWITNGYSLVEDEGIWDESVPKRNYKHISYLAPSSVSEQLILAKPKQKNLKMDDEIKVEVVSIDHESSNSRIEIALQNEESETIYSEVIDIKIDKNLNKQELSLNIGRLKTGKYELIILNTYDTILKESICIHPSIPFDEIEAELTENKNQLINGTINTLQFELNQIENKLAELKIYETGEKVLEDWNIFKDKYELFIVGVDPYQVFVKPYRRAFKSKYDDTYQPYSLKLPRDYNPQNKYPLLVYLHGSGKDEQGLLDRPRSGGNFIEIAPLARDIYRAYAEDYSQRDIVEAIEDVCTYFSVDADKVIIGGFSMGGYGALRTFYEHPELYKGVAVHAGHPNIANEWLDGDHPNFLDEKYLSSFFNIPVFIYHGRKDAGLDVRLIEEMSKKLTNAGALVTTRIIEQKGHEYPDDLTNEIYFKWLRDTVTKR